MQLICGSWSRRRAGSTAAPSGWSRRRPRRCGPGSAWRSAPRGRPRAPARRSTAPAAASPGAPTPRPEHAELLRQGRRPGRTTSPEHRLLETLRVRAGRRGCATLDRHLARMADSADWLGFRFDRRRRPGRRCPGRLAAAPTRRGSGCWLSRDGARRRRGGAAARRPAAGPVRLGAGRRPGGRRRARGCSTRRRRRDVYLTRAPAAPRGRRRRPGQPARRADGDHHREPGAAHRRPLVDPADDVGLPARRRAGPAAGVGPPARAGALGRRPGAGRGDRRAQLAAGLAGGPAPRRPAARAPAPPGDRGAFSRRGLVSGQAQGPDELDGQSIGDFLRQLAARMAAPGAGATAAVEAALSASLVAMVGRFTTAEEHADSVRRDRGGGRRPSRGVPRGRRRRRGRVHGGRRGDEAARTEPPRSRSPGGPASPRPSSTRPGRRSPSSNRPPSWSSWRPACCRSPTATSSAMSPRPPPPPVPPPRRRAWPSRRISPGIEDDDARMHLASAVAVVEDLARRADEVEAEVRKVMHG